MCESIFNKRPPLKEKHVNHPWEKSIKNIYSDKIKRAHNSIQNPIYPKVKEDKFKNARVRFTVIGNSLTKEFVYCAHLAQAMHKYRKKIFKSPVIRAVTQVQWPSVWNDLKIKYGGEAYCLLTQVAILRNEQFFGGDKELKEYMESHYIYHVCLDYHKQAIKNFTNCVKNTGRPFAYLQISIDDEEIGTLIFMLYADLLPNTCENFLRLCKSKRGGYSGTPVHRIVKDCWIQCGGFCLKDTDLRCENFMVPHDRRGVLGMCNDGRDNDCSTQFFVLLQPAPWMAYKYVAFGQLIDGEETLKKIQAIPTWYESPTSSIMIYKAGLLNTDCKDIHINKGAQAYLHMHIEDLVSLEDMLKEAIMQRVWAELRARGPVKKIKSPSDITLPDIHEQESNKGFKEEPKKSLKLSTSNTSNTQKSGSLKSLPRGEDKENEPPHKKSPSESFEDFDMEGFMYEFEGSSQASPAQPDVASKPIKPFYLPLTDVPYPDEKDSNFDLKRLLQGDYCLEGDLEPHLRRRRKRRKEYEPTLTPLHSPVEFGEEYDFFAFINRYSNDDKESSSSETEEDEKETAELKAYLKTNVDRISFAGSVIKNIVKESMGTDTPKRSVTLVYDENLKKIRVEDEAKDPGQQKAAARKSTVISLNDEELRKVRLSEMSRGPRFSGSTTELPPLNEDMLRRRMSKVPAATEDLKKRRKTFFSADLATVKNFIKEEKTGSDSDEEKQGKVLWRLPSGVTKTHKEIKRRPTGFIKKDDLVKMGITDEDEQKVVLADADGTHDIHKEIARRATAFITKEEMAAMLAAIEEEEEEEEEQEKEEEKEAESPEAPESDTEPIKEQESMRDKAKRRQTEFAVDLEKVKLIDRVRRVSDDSDEDDTSDAHKLLFNIPEGSNKEARKAIRRRPTGFVRKQDLAKMGLSVDEESQVIWNIPPGMSRQEIHEIQRRATGYAGKKQLDEMGFPLEEEEEEDTKKSPDIKKAIQESKLPIPKHQAGYAHHVDDSAQTLKHDEEENPFLPRGPKHQAGYAHADDSPDETEYDQPIKVAGKEKRTDSEDSISIGDEQSAYKGVAQKHGKAPTKSDLAVPSRISQIGRLYEDNLKDENFVPTLKNYRPRVESVESKNLLLTLSTKIQDDSTEVLREKSPIRRSISLDNENFKRVAGVQYGKTVTSKLSSDYVTRLNQLEHYRQYKSLSSVAYSRIRPTITVKDYQRQNKIRREQAKKLDE